MAAVTTFSPASRVGPAGGALHDSDWHGGEDGSGNWKPLPLRRYRTGIWFALVPITMMFAAFGSAYIVRQGLGDDWQATGLPPMIWWNSALLFASSLTMEMARRKARILPLPGSEAAARITPFTRVPAVRRWLLGTLLLGGLFVAGQVLLWSSLAERGIYMASNPSSSFFYVLTVAHALHVCFGIAGLGSATAATWKRLTPGGRTGVGVAAVYWHFMGGLWIYLVALLVFAP